MENWQKIKDIFADAIEQPADLRAEFLRAKCDGDNLLFDEVSSLLAASGDFENLIEKNAFDLSSVVGCRVEDYRERHFGKYRIIREIGSGGMGSVFLAERDDGEFTMQVALKIVRQSIADREIISRFRRERQILAGLSHPNIAALHDGGVSEKGEPYLAMEYVDGQTLIDYSVEHNLSIDKKLRLFLKICAAVSYAHRHLVVHRDIKPSNILVTEDREPKLLDFGLAKAFESDSSKTQTALRAFTPAYASPEQIKGGNITTSSDIYSLGVVFYELLTGTKPLNFDNKSFDEIVQTIGGTEPLKPSAVETELKPAHTAQILRGDLDNIALTALRKEPERRFKTVDDFADDIERHLNGRPITARPNTAGYLAGKFIRRNKIAVAAAAFVLLSLVVGLIFSLWQADRVRKERDRAEKRFQDVRQLSNSLLFEISPKIERLPGSVEAREILVKRALEYLDSLSEESQYDQSLRAELASAYEKVGNLQGNIDRPNLSDFAGAVTSFEKARAIRESLPLDSENQYRLALNVSLTSSIRNRQNDVKGSLTDAGLANAIFIDLTSTIPDSIEYKTSAIEAEIEYGQIYSMNNRFAEAVPRFRGALAALARIDNNQIKTRQLTAKGYAFLGNALSWDGNQPDAETEIKKAIIISESLAADYPDDSEIQATVWQTFTLASSVYEDTQPSFSLDLAKRALTIAERAAGADKADSQARYNVGRAFSRLGIMFSKSQKLSQAETNLQESEKIFNELIVKEPKNVIYQRDLGKLYVRMGDTSEKQQNPADALLKYQNSALIFEKIADGDGLNTLALRDLAQSLKSVGAMQIALKQKAEAIKTLEKAKQILANLKAANSIGGFDKQLIEEVETLLRSF